MVKTNRQKLQVIQKKKTFHGIIHSPCYRRNTVIHNELHISFIRSVIKNNGMILKENIPTIPNLTIQNVCILDQRAG